MKIKLTRRAKRRLIAIMMMAVIGALMIGFGWIAVMGGTVMILGAKWASAAGMIVAFMAFMAVLALGGLFGRLVEVHFR